MRAAAHSTARRNCAPKYARQKKGQTENKKQKQGKSVALEIGIRNVNGCQQSNLKLREARSQIRTDSDASVAQATGPQQCNEHFVTCPGSSLDLLILGLRLALAGLQQVSFQLHGNSRVPAGRDDN